MRVSFDARFIGLAGIGRMTAELWRALVELQADVVGLWPAEPQLDWMGTHRPGPAGTHVVIRARPFLPAEQLVLPRVIRQVGADVHHAPNYAFPHLTRRPVVLTVHDLFPYLEPKIARSRGAAAVYRVIIPLAVRHARIIVAVSRFTADQLMETFGIGGERVRVIEHGIDRARWKRPPSEQIAAVRGKYELPSEYLLYVGTVKPNKNIGTLLAAHRPSHPPLVFAGAGRPEFGRAGLATDGLVNVIPLGRVPDADLAALYAGALALVLPSLYEGAGFTPLEAMASGTPVVSSNGGALSDTVGDAGLLVPPQDVGAWSEALSTISEQASLRQELASAGQQRVSRRSWKQAAREYLDVYREAAG